MITPFEGGPDSVLQSSLIKPTCDLYSAACRVEEIRLAKESSKRHLAKSSFHSQGLLSSFAYRWTGILSRVGGMTAYLHRNDDSYVCKQSSCCSKSWVAIRRSAAPTGTRTGLKKAMQIKVRTPVILAAKAGPAIGRAGGRPGAIGKSTNSFHGQLSSVLDRKVAASPSVVG